MQIKTFYSLRDTAQILGISLDTLRRCIDDKLIPKPITIKGKWGKKYPVIVVKVMNSLMKELEVKGKWHPRRYLKALDFKERVIQRLKYGKENKEK